MRIIYSIYGQMVPNRRRFSWHHCVQNYLGRSSLQPLPEAVSVIKLFVIIMKRTITSSLVTKKKHVKINQTNLDKAMGDQLRRALDLHWIVERQIPGLMAMYRQKSNPVQNSMIVSVRQAVNAQNMVHFQRLFR